jgi:protein gp37
MAQTAIEWTWRRARRGSLTLSQLEFALEIGAIVSGSEVVLPGFTFNPWIGCTKVDELCAHCYAATQDKFRHWTPEGWGPGKPRKRTSAANWAKVKAWNASAAKVGVRLRVFCASLADWLDDDGVPIEWLADLLELIRTTPHIDWLLLTKRPQNWRSRIEAITTTNIDLAAWLLAWLLGPGEFGTGPFDGLQSPGAPENVWIGTSVGTQKSADTRIPELLKIPARVRFLSCEPLLEEVDISWALPWTKEVGERVATIEDATLRQLGENLLAKDAEKPFVDWVICGGESGTGARPMHPDWAGTLREQCAAAGVPFFMKQWGEWAPCAETSTTVSITAEKPGGFKNPQWHRFPDGQLMGRIGKQAAGKTLDSREHSESPNTDEVRA